MLMENTGSSMVDTPTDQSLRGMGDPRRDDFLRVINKRLPVALERIRLIKNCFSNPYKYFYTNDDLDLVEKKLLYAIDEIRAFKKYGPLR